MSELRAALENALGPIYRVEREVRPVGNCRLFVAVGPLTDPELLVKVLPGELSLAVDARVFERELILLADRLGHAQLVAPRGAGRAGSIVYHSRRFIEGTTLRAWLANHGELPLRRTVDILRDVLVALAHAHRGSIAHGDLKPENVLLAGRRVLVADTGIVDALTRALPSGVAGAVSGRCAHRLTSRPNAATAARPPGRVTTFSRSECCCTRCSLASPPRSKRSPSRKCARYRRGWRSWRAAVSHRSPLSGGPTPPRRWSRSAGRTRERCETRAGALLPPHRRAARAGRHAGAPVGVRTPDDGAGACGLENAHAGSVRRTGTRRCERTLLPSDVR